MPWLIGIDEAGYGPNLGPFVMTAVACRVPGERPDLWRLLASAVRRHSTPDDGRIVIEDSKLLYSTARGLDTLELGVLAALSPWGESQSLMLHQLLERWCPQALAELCGEPWYRGTSGLPVAAGWKQCATAAERVERVCREQGVSWGGVQSMVVCPTRFNQLMEETNSKGAVLAHGLTHLVASQLPTVDGPVHFFVDKHGGRNTYAAMLQHALPDGFVVAVQEGMERSVYQVHGLGRAVSLTIQPRADSEHFCVALASMVSKYLREVLMREFNGFWQTHVPGLKPTAGYPGDASRFLEAIRAAARRLEVAEEALWRRK